MTTQEIRIGNLFKYKGQTVEFAIEDFAEADHNSQFLELLVKPIVLTSEWMEKFGFEFKEGKGWQIIGWLYMVEQSDCFMPAVGGDFSGARYRYVHELQNLYYGLAGKELTIKTKDE